MIGTVIDTALAVLISVGAFAVLLPLIVFIHEYGHFKVARLCGVRVDTFSIGFGKALTSWTDKKGTVWKIAAIPLGGYVKFFGDANAASAGTTAADGEDASQKPMTTQFNSERDRLASTLTEEEKKVCFHFKPVWQRMAVVAAGPFANFILAIVIFTGLLLAFGERTLEPVVGVVQEDTAAAAAGFEPGDRILAVNGRKIRDFDDLRMRVTLSAESERDFLVERDGEEVTLVATPRRTAQEDALGNEVNQGRLGIIAFTSPIVDVIQEDSAATEAGFAVGDRIVSIGNTPVFSYSEFSEVVRAAPGEPLSVRVLRDGSERELTLTPRAVAVPTGEGDDTIDVGVVGMGPAPIPFIRYSVLEAPVAAVGQVGRIVDGTLTYLGRLVTFQEDPRQLGGPIKISKFAGQAVMSGFNENLDVSFERRLLISFTTFIQLAALISVSIGLLNLLPIPVLDGGHLVYYAYEAVAGKPLSDRVQGFGFRVGLAIVGTFMVFVIVNDVMQLF